MDHTAKPAGPGQINIKKGMKCINLQEFVTREVLDLLQLLRLVGHLAKPEEHMVVHPW